MTRIAALLALFQLLCFAGPAMAQADVYSTPGATLVSQQSWIEEWDADEGRWVRVSEITTRVENADTGLQVHEAARYAKPAKTAIAKPPLAHYGPFIVTSVTRAAMIGATDRQSPALFDAMLRDFPAISTLDLIEAPGTSNDIANLEVARKIRALGISTHVPDNGSVRSGAVEIFLAGATRTMDDGAQFAVHSWLDNYGRQAVDLAADDPAHRIYIDFYIDMGMSEGTAVDFYAMTNSVPHHSALWLDASEMRTWLHEDTVADIPVLDYGDISGVWLASLDLSRLDSWRAFP